MDSNRKINQAAGKPSNYNRRPEITPSPSLIPNKNGGNGGNGLVKKNSEIENGGMISINGGKNFKDSGQEVSRNIIVIDTNVLIEDPNAINILRTGGNLLVVPITVINELDKLKIKESTRQNANDAAIIIDGIEDDDPTFFIETEMIYPKLSLDKNKPDHQIIATLNYVVKQFIGKHGRYAGFQKIKMISNDKIVKIISRKIKKINPSSNLIVEAYKKSQSTINKKRMATPLIKISEDAILDAPEGKFIKMTQKLRSIKERGYVVVYSNDLNKKEGEYVAIREGRSFRILDDKIKAYGIGAKSNDAPNWEQIAALDYLLDPGIACVILQGGAGTGKTLLCLAAALQLGADKKYSQTIISRPVVPLDYDQQQGYLPGDVNQKMAPWLLPIQQNLKFILRLHNREEERKKNELEMLERRGANISDDFISDKKKEKRGRGKRDRDKGYKKVEKEKVLPKNEEAKKNEQTSIIDMLHQNGIFIQPLESIRGTTFSNCLIIIDEAQNLTRHQAKTIATRVGDNTKIIFNGDLSQIDNRHLDKSTSGLAYLMNSLSGSSMVGIVNFKETLRSPFASLAERVLR